MPTKTRQLILPPHEPGASAPDYIEREYRVVDVLTGLRDWEQSHHEVVDLSTQVASRKYISTTWTSGQLYKVCDHTELWASGLGGLTDMVDDPEPEEGEEREHVIGESHSFHARHSHVLDTFLKRGTSRLDQLFSLGNLAAWLTSSGQLEADSKFHELRNPLNPNFNMITFLREGREVVKLLVHLRTYRKRLRRLLRLLFRENNRHYTWKQVSLMIAQEHLTWAFGILPMISDLKKLFQILTNLHEGFEAVFNGKAKTHFYMRVDNNPAMVQAPIGRPFYNWNLEGQFKTEDGQWWSYLVPGSNVHKGYARYYVRAGKQIESEGGSILAFFDLLGLHPNLGVLWDAIPFTFIIDWFLDIGDKLEDVGVESFIPVNMTMTDAAHHARFSVTRSWLYQPDKTTPTDVSTTDIAFVEHLDQFVRRPYLPVASQQKLKRALGLREVLLSASLARALRR